MSNIYAANIPVDDATLRGVRLLIEAWDLPKRAQGVVVRRLVSAECKRLGLLDDIEKEVTDVINQGVVRDAGMVTQ